MSLARTFIRYGFAPTFFAGFIGLALVLVASGQSKWILIPLLLVAILTMFAAERLLPYEPAWNRDRRDFGRDAAHALVNEGSSAASVAAVPLLAGLLPGPGLWPEAWPLWAQLGMAILIADIGITLAHYASHKWEPLWRLHAVHHSVERMYGFNGLMKHPIHQMIETLAGTAPLLLLGLPMEVAALLGFAVAVQLLLQHANVDVRIGRFGYVWAIATGHRHHHLASKTDGDVNFGLFTTLTDHLLGTFVAGRPTPRDGEIGVAGARDYPRSYLRQLLEPFRSERKARPLTVDPGLPD